MAGEACSPRMHLPTRTCSGRCAAAEQFADGGPPGYRKMKSDYGRAPLSAEAIDIVLRFMARSPHREDAIQFQGWGGAINRVPAAATAFPHRAMLFLMQYI